MPASSPASASCTSVRRSSCRRRCSRAHPLSDRRVLQTIITRSLLHRHAVLALALALLVYGVWSAANARLDVLPDFAPPQADVQSEAPGFAPEQVERLVTLPIETALAGVPGLQALRSESIQGLSVVTAVFDESTNVYVARQDLA